MAKVVAESGDYNAAKVGTTQFLGGVYKNIDDQVGFGGQAIQIYFPDTGPWSDVQANDWVPQDINLGYTTISLNQRPGYPILIRNFEQWLSSVSIADVIVDPLYKRGMEYINGQIAAQLTTANFNAYPPVVSSKTPTVTNALAPGNGSSIDVPDLANAWAILAGNKVPVDDTEDMALFTHSDVHSNMMITPSFVQESLVGAVIASRAREEADIGAPFKFNKRWDQQCGKANSLGTPTPVLTGTGFSSSAAVVTGTGSKFTQQLEVGDTFITNTSGATDINRVVTVTDDTHVTLAATPATTISATTATKVGYTSIAMHRYAIAFVARPLELVNSGELMQSRLIRLAGIPFRVQMSYVHMKSAWLLTADIGMAVKVIRPDFGVIIKS